MVPNRVPGMCAEEMAQAIEAASISYEEAIRAGRSQDAERIALASLSEGVPVAVLYEQVLAPAMTRIGALWATGEMTIADEHLASAFNFKVMASVYSVSLAHRPTANIGRVLLAGVEGDRHGVGLRMAGDVLDLSGYEVLYLGENVSARDLVRAAAARRPDVIAVAIPTEAARAAGEATLRELESCCPEIPVLVGGRGMPIHSSGRVRALTSKLTELVPSVAQLIPPGREEEAATSWPGMDQVPLSVRATNVAATPEDRLLDIAAEAAETTRAHARVAHAYRRLAHEDPLTGAPNRRAFDDRINELLEDEVEASLILIDLDGFKQVNDLCGHAAGDKVLQRVAKLIAEGIPERRLRRPVRWRRVRHPPAARDPGGRPGPRELRARRAEGGPGRERRDRDRRHRPARRRPPPEPDQRRPLALPGEGGRRRPDRVAHAVRELLSPAPAG